MLCSLLQLARRLIKHELGEQHSQSTGNKHEYAIIQQWKSAKFTENESANVSGNHYAGRKQATKNGSEKRQTHKRNDAAVAV